MPNPRYKKPVGKPEGEWPTRYLLTGVWTIFPHVSIADFNAGNEFYIVSQLFPCGMPDESVTVPNVLASAPPRAEERKVIDEMMVLLETPDGDLPKRFEAGLD